MNSSVVNRAIRSLVWPVIKERAFTSFTGRAAWRDRDQLIDIINFQSFNRYNSDVLGCTTFSFAINLSVYLVDVPSDHPPPIRNGRLRPAEHHGHLRRRLGPVHPHLPKAADIWFVDEQGDNTRDVMVQAAAGLTKAAAALGSLRSRISALCSLFFEALQHRRMTRRGYPAHPTLRRATRRLGTWPYRLAIG
jgi:hypothetical protein